MSLAEEKKLNAEFRQAQPFPHLVIPNFLIKEQAGNLLKALAQERFLPKEADLFKLMQTDDLAGTKNKNLQEFRRVLASQEFVGWLSKVTGITLTPGVIDMAGSLYQDTDFLLCHDDRLEGRKIAYMYYLSDFKEREGGSLNFLGHKGTTPTKVLRKIAPKFNTFVFFEVSPHSFHEVEEVLVKKQRITIGGWFHG